MRAAEYFGYAFKKRSTDTIHLDIRGRPYVYQLIAVLPYSQMRKVRLVQAALDVATRVGLHWVWVWLWGEVYDPRSTPLSTCVFFALVQIMSIVVRDQQVSPCRKTLCVAAPAFSLLLPPPTKSTPRRFVNTPLPLFSLLRRQTAMAGRDLLVHKRRGQQAYDPVAGQ